MNPFPLSEVHITVPSSDVRVPIHCIWWTYSLVLLDTFPASKEPTPCPYWTTHGHIHWKYWTSSLFTALNVMYPCTAPMYCICWFGSILGLDNYFVYFFFSGWRTKTLFLAWKTDNILLKTHSLSYKMFNTNLFVQKIQLRKITPNYSAFSQKYIK